MATSRGVSLAFLVVVAAFLVVNCQPSEDDARDNLERAISEVKNVEKTFRGKDDYLKNKMREIGQPQRNSDDEESENEGEAVQSRAAQNDDDEERPAKSNRVREESEEEEEEQARPKRGRHVDVDTQEAEDNDGKKADDDDDEQPSKGRSVRGDDSDKEEEDDDEEKEAPKANRASRKRHDEDEEDGEAGKGRSTQKQDADDEDEDDDEKKPQKQHRVKFVDERDEPEERSEDEPQQKRPQQRKQRDDDDDDDEPQVRQPQQTQQQQQQQQQQQRTQGRQEQLAKSIPSDKRSNNTKASGLDDSVSLPATPRNSTRTYSKPSSSQATLSPVQQQRNTNPRVGVEDDEPATPSEKASKIGKVVAQLSQMGEGQITPILTDEIHQLYQQTEKIRGKAAELERANR